MSDQEDRDMANTVVMLDEAVTARVCDAMLCLFDGTDEPPYVIVNNDDPIHKWANRESIKTAIWELLKPELQQLIRQEIANAFSDGGGCTKVVNIGDTVRVDTSLIVS